MKRGTCMTDAELSAWWPDLGHVVEGLRRIDQGSVAGLLLDAVMAGCSSSEIIGSVGGLLHEYRALRTKLSATESDAWAAVMKDFYRAFPGARLRHWVSAFMG